MTWAFSESTGYSSIGLPTAAQNRQTSPWASTVRAPTPYARILTRAAVKKACHRHDFGYRNYKRQCRFTKLGKERIDKNFKKDMYFQCGKHKATKGLCKLIARLYYKAVKHWGKRNASENLTRNIRSIAGDWKSLGPAIAIEHKLLASGGLHGLIARDGQLANETEAGHGEPWDSEGDGWSDKDEDELSVSELGLGDKGDHSRFLVAVSVGPDGSVKLTANGVTQLLPPGVVDVDDDTVADAWRKVIGTILGDVPPALSA